MKKFINLLFVAGLLAISNSYAFASEPKEVLASFISALSKGDKVKVFEVLSPKVTIYESGYVERTRAEYEAHHMDGDMQFAKTSIQKIIKQTELIEANLAVIMQETETKANLNGQDVIILGTTTATLEKTKGKWLITHIHWSARKPKNV